MKNYHGHMKEQEWGQIWRKKEDLPKQGNSMSKPCTRRIGRGAPDRSVRLEERFRAGHKAGPEEEPQVRPQEPWELLETTDLCSGQE